MRLVNNTHWPDEKIKEMFDLCAKPLGINAMKVNVNDAEIHNGNWGWSYLYGGKKEITITTGRKKSFPYLSERKRRVINSRDRWEKYSETNGHEIWRVNTTNTSATNCAGANL